MSADAACQHDTALLTARLCRWWFAGEVKTALQLEAVSFIGSASIERITLAIFLIFLNGWWPYHLHAFAAMPRPGNWAPRSISRSNFSQVTGGACRKCWYGNKVFGRSLANIPKWSGSRCMPEPRKRIDWLQVASVFLWLCSVQFAQEWSHEGMRWGQLDALFTWKTDGKQFVTLDLLCFPIFQQNLPYFWRLCQQQRWVLRPFERSAIAGVVHKLLRCWQRPSDLACQQDSMQVSPDRAMILLAKFWFLATPKINSPLVLEMLRLLRRSFNKEKKTNVSKCYTVPFPPTNITIQQELTGKYQSSVPWCLLLKQSGHQTTTSARGPDKKPQVFLVRRGKDQRWKPAWSETCSSGWMMLEWISTDGFLQK